MEHYRDNLHDATQIVPSAPNYDDTLRRKDNMYENGNSYTDHFNTFARNTLRRKRRRQGNTASDVFNNPASGNDLASFLQNNFPDQSFSSNLNNPPPAYSLTDPLLPTSTTKIKLSKHIKIPPNPPEPESTIFLVDTSSASKPFLNQVKTALSNIKFYKQTSPHLITFSNDIVAWRKHDQLLVSGKHLVSIKEIEQISKENSHSTDTQTFLSDVENLNSSGKSCLYSAILFAMNYSCQIKTSFSKIIILNSGHSKTKNIGLNSDILEHVSIIARFHGIQINVVELKQASNEHFFEKICNESGGKLITCPEDTVKKITELYEAPLSNLKQTCVKVCAKHGRQSEFYPGNLATRSDFLDFEVFSGGNDVCVTGKIEGDKEFGVSFKLNM